MIETLHFEEDPENPGEYLLVFPEGLLEKAGIIPGDEIIWEIHKNDDDMVWATIKKK
jgi:hypothetical protein